LVGTAGAAVAVMVGVSEREAQAQPSTPPDDSFFEAGQLGPPAEPAPAPNSASGAEPSAPAYEPPAPPFGARGELVVTGGSSAGISWQTFDSSQARYFSAAFSPGLDWFVARNVSIGVTGSVGYGDSQGYGADGSLVDTRSTSWSIGPRVGVNLPLGERFSWYPMLAVGFESVHEENTLVSGSSLSAATSPLGYSTTTMLGPWLDLYAPVLFHPKPHLFIGFGPSWFQDFGHAQGGPDVGGQRTNVGAGLVVGGWWRGAADAQDIENAPPPPAELRPHRFGLVRQVVVDSSLVLSAHYTTYAGSSSGVTTLAFAPGLDYFVGDHFSLGLAGNLSSTSDKAVDPTTSQPVNFSETSTGAALRMGVDVPLGHWLSLYPRASIGFGRNSYDETSGSNENKNDEAITWVGLNVPLLVHPASHFFVGFGPSVSRDLDRSIIFPGFTDLPGGAAVKSENRSTTVGASLVVGGWFET
jgi:opacity protein-like surface antigen